MNDSLNKFQMRTKIFIVPAKDVRHVNLTFPIEDMGHYYSASPGDKIGIITKAGLRFS